MLRTKLRFQSFEDYLAYEDGSEELYELFNGELVLVPPESGANVQIATFLLLQFAALLDFRCVRGQGLELEVRGEPKNRFPDLTIIREEHIQQMLRRNTIRLAMAPPLLVVEVVSPGEIQHDRDYIAKRTQYEDRGIAEYWLADPALATVAILELRDRRYESLGQFRDSQRLVSGLFPTLNLTAEQVLNAGC
jgi:Uma2 family endonuclease